MSCALANHAPLFGGIPLLVRRRIPGQRHPDSRADASPHGDSIRRTHAPSNVCAVVVAHWPADRDANHGSAHRGSDVDPVSHADGRADGGPNGTHRGTDRCPHGAHWGSHAGTHRAHGSPNRCPHERANVNSNTPRRVDHVGS